MPPLLADFTHARVCKPFCEKFLTLPTFLRKILDTTGKPSAVPVRAVRESPLTDCR